MSHHGFIYRVFPDDDKSVPDDKWLKADLWINGMKTYRDLNEAIACARLGRLSCQTPFIVHEIPMGGIRPKECYYWLVDK